MQTGRLVLLAVLIGISPGPIGVFANGDRVLPPLVDSPIGVEQPDVAEQVIGSGQNLESICGEPFERVLMTLEHRQGWRSIAWRKDVGAALKDAKVLGKPVAVVIMLPEYGQSSSPFS